MKLLPRNIIPPKMKSRFLPAIIIAIYLAGCSSGGNSDGNNSKKQSTENTSVSAANSVLFKDYVFGQPRAKYEATTVAEDCSDEAEDVLCLKERTTFLGYEFDVELNFTDKKLNSVSLAALYSDDLFAKVLSSLPSNNFTTVYFLFGKKNLDILAASQKSKPEAIMSYIIKNLTILEEEDRLDEFSGILMENLNGADGKIRYRAKNYPELFRQIPENNRVIQLSFFYDEAQEQYYLILDFLLKKSLVTKENF